MMPKPENELTGPRVYVTVGGTTPTLHLTGGYNKPNRTKTMCGVSLAGRTLVDARDIAPHYEYRDAKLWCKRCLAMLDFEGLDQKVLFSAIEFKIGTYSDLILKKHMERPSKKPKHPFSLTNAPPRKDWRIVK